MAKKSVLKWKRRYKTKGCRRHFQYYHAYLFSLGEISYVYVWPVISNVMHVQIKKWDKLKNDYTVSFDDILKDLDPNPAKAVKQAKRMIENVLLHPTSVNFINSLDPEQ